MQAFDQHYALELSTDSSETTIGAGMMFSLFFLKASIDRFLVNSVLGFGSVVAIQALLTIYDCITRVAVRDLQQVVLVWLYGVRGKNSIQCSPEYNGLLVSISEARIWCELLSILLVTGASVLGNFQASPEISQAKSTIAAQGAIQLSMEIFNSMVVLFYEHYIHNIQLNKERKRSKLCLLNACYVGVIFFSYCMRHLLQAIAVPSTTGQTKETSFAMGYLCNFREDDCSMLNDTYDTWYIWRKPTNHYLNGAEDPLRHVYRNQSSIHLYDVF